MSFPVREFFTLFLTLQVRANKALDLRDATEELHKVLSFKPEVILEMNSNKKNSITIVTLISPIPILMNVSLQLEKTIVRTG